MSKLDVLKQIVPPPVAVLREGLIVLGGILLAAYFISHFPTLQKFVMANSITVKSEDGQVYF